MNNQEYEAVVIGFGKGGKTLASYLGNKGIDVAVIEQSKAMYGGTCINIACIPSKALALAAEGAYKSKFNTLKRKKPITGNHWLKRMSSFPSFVSGTMTI